MIIINKIQLQIKIKRLKRRLIEKWYKLVKPLANLIDKADSIKDKIYNKKVENITIEKASKLLSKAIIEDFVRHSSIDGYEIELEVAKRSQEYCGDTVLEYINKFTDNKYLKTWAWRVKDEDKVNHCKTLAEILIHGDLKKYGVSIKVYKRDYGIYKHRIPEDYQYTIQISL